MSNLEAEPRETACQASATTRTAELLPGHDVALGRYTTVRRMLPHRERRMVGAWCFLDHFGPQSIINLPGMRVPPHPHTGLQTVTWLLEGEILHRDSLGSRQTILPGQLNLMTSGRGIAHSEESPENRPPSLHGLQLWIALPDGARDGEPSFEHHPTLPRLDEDGASVTIVAGELAGSRAPTRVHTPLFGAEIALAAGAGTRVPVEREFEYAAVVLSGSAAIDGVDLTPGALLYLGFGHAHFLLRAEHGARLFLFGGEPFEEELVMWWNFVARSHEEIVAARADWASQDARFGPVLGYDGDRLPVPALPTTRLRPRGRTPR